MNFDPAAIEAGAKALAHLGEPLGYTAAGRPMRSATWDDYSTDQKDQWRADATMVAIAVALATNEDVSFPAIDSAPKDGTWFIAWSAEDKILRRISWGASRHDELCWCSRDLAFGPGYLTHWCPLPGTVSEPFSK